MFSKKGMVVLVLVLFFGAISLGAVNSSIAETVCKGDFDRDGDVDGSDLAVFAANFGRTDCPLSNPVHILITEIMANQEGPEMGGAGEFVELINTGDFTVNLDNLWIAVGPPGTPVYDQLQSFRTGTTLLLPGAYAVIVDPNYDDRYSFPPGTVLVTVGDAAFDSSGLATTHWVTLYDVDGITLLDEFRYPSDPGDGVSLCRVSLTAPDDYSNWIASPSGSSPGDGACAQVKTRR